MEAFINFNGSDTEVAKPGRYYKFFFLFPGSNVKKAKFFLAKAAILGLYGVESTFEVPA